MKLQYVGATPTTFITGTVGEVRPGDEFTVTEELSPSFLARADVKEVEEVTVEKLFSKQRHVVEPDQSVVIDDGNLEKMSEENDGIPNDH